MVWAESTLPLQLRNTNERSSTNGMQNAPPRLPSRGPASIHCSLMARSTSPPRGWLYDVNAPRTISKPSVHEIELGANGSGANRSYHGSAPGRPCSRALACIQRRRSGSAASTAACIASNVARVTLLANSDASIGLSQPRRRLTMLASPFTAFIAAAHVTATVGQARISAS